ncbi:MAG: hypothetical protein H0T76_21080 [Nannocystis sp.]|nr:c-type cytochrome domain-containing protein [Nannocystis sp.]MBA3548984.1 hypothetical protein [Nannocystis sp.]
MSLRSTPPIRAISGAALATVISLSFGACSPVKLSDDTEATDTTDSAATDGISSGGSGSESGGAEGGEAVPTACVELAPRILGVLETNCAKCHGPGSSGQGGIDYILDVQRLIETDKVVPGDPEASRIYARMVSPASPMPPVAEMKRPSDTDIESIGKWIEQCAGVQSCGDQAFIDKDTMLKAISTDLSSSDAISSENRKFIRYFSFVHLHNAGWCDSEIELFRQSLSKTVNSLSQETQIKPPVAIDTQRLIFRVDISDYDWDRDDGEDAPRLSEPSFYFRRNETEIAQELGKTFADKWEMIADQNPYNVEFLGQTAEDIKNDTETKFPIMQGDAFIDAATRSPLYYDILGIPGRSGRLLESDLPCANVNDCLETQLGINIIADIKDELENNKAKVARAGFHESDVSDFNRVIERHLFANANNRAFWISYDFASESGFSNIGVHPLDFDFDGGEIIFNLPNGMQAYMLTDKKGTRLNEGPINIVQDESQKDFLVRNGVSCMGCHSAGMIKVQDDIGHELRQGLTETQFDDLEKDQIRRLYPTRDEFDVHLEEDIRRFNESLTLAGVEVGGAKEPIITSFLSFDENVGLRRSGAEFMLREQVMAKDVGRLSPDLLELTKTGGTVQRQDFTSNYAASACILNLGLTRCCPNKTDQLDPICKF